MTIGQQVKMKTNGFEGQVIDKFTEGNGTIHWKVKYFVPNSNWPNMGYWEEFGSFFLEHELEGKGD